MICFGRVITWPTGIQVTTGQANVKVAPKGSIKLNSPRNSKLGIDGALL